MTQKEEKMFALVDTWRQSGEKRKEFCDKHHINVSTLAYWITRKNKSEHSESGFLPVDISRGSGHCAARVDIHYPNGIRLCLDGAEVALISKLIRLY